MTIDVFFTTAEVDPVALEGRTAVVVDVIRATTTMVEALANGARGIFPTVSTEDAIKLAFSLGREDTILCGERKWFKVEGFDLGNSPTEFLSEVVMGKQLVMSTTNGTRALVAAEDATRVLALSFLNLSAVAEAVRGEEELVIVCAGQEDRFSLDDALCAGLLIRKLVDGREGEVELNDAGKVALDLGKRTEVSVGFLKTTAAGNALTKVGLEGDLEICASLDRYALVPEMTERRLSLPGKKKRA